MYIQTKNFFYILFLFLCRVKTTERFDTDMMAKEFLMAFTNHVLSVSQPLLFPLPDKHLMLITIKSIEGKFNTLYLMRINIFVIF